MFPVFSETYAFDLFCVHETQSSLQQVFVLNSYHYSCVLCQRWPTRDLFLLTRVYKFVCWQQCGKQLQLLLWNFNSRSSMVLCSCHWILDQIELKSRSPVVQTCQRWWIVKRVTWIATSPSLSFPSPLSQPHSSLSHALPLPILPLSPSPPQI